MTMADKNCPLYTKETDGTIQKWYLFSWSGPNFAISPVRNAKFRDFKRYYSMDDVGKTIFLSRKEAQAAPVPAHTSPDGQSLFPLS